MNRRPVSVDVPMHGPRRPARAHPRHPLRIRGPRPRGGGRPPDRALSGALGRPQGRRDRLRLRSDARGDASAAAGRGSHRRARQPGTARAGAGGRSKRGRHLFAARSWIDPARLLQRGGTDLRAHRRRAERRRPAGRAMGIRNSSATWKRTACRRWPIACKRPWRRSASASARFSRGCSATAPADRTRRLRAKPESHLDRGLAAGRCSAAEHGGRCAVGRPAEVLSLDTDQVMAGNRRTKPRTMWLSSSSLSSRSNPLDGG